MGAMLGTTFVIVSNLNDLTQFINKSLSCKQKKHTI